MKRHPLALGALLSAVTIAIVVTALRNSESGPPKLERVAEAGRMESAERGPDPVVPPDVRAASSLQWEDEDAELVDSPATVSPDSAVGVEEQRVRKLLLKEERFRNAVGPNRTMAAFNLCTYSVAMILRKHGRADRGSPEEIARLGGLSFRPETPTQWVFSSDDARFRFEQGEFPEYDRVRAFYDARRTAPPAELPESLVADVETLLTEAKGLLGVSR